MAHILVIDDEPDMRQLLQALLALDGHDVALAADGAEGLAASRARRPDLVVTDIMMPNKEGIETIRDLRREAPDLPILVMSGDPGSALYLQVATLLGAHAALSKPFGADALLRAVNGLLNAG